MLKNSNSLAYIAGVAFDSAYNQVPMLGFDENISLLSGITSANTLYSLISIPKTTFENESFSTISPIGYVALNYTEMLTNITSISAPPSNDYVMYYGDNPSYTPINSNYDLSVVYNVCDSWQYGQGSAVLTLNNDNASSSSQVIYSCSGTAKFNRPAGSKEMSNSSFFHH